MKSQNRYGAVTVYVRERGSRSFKKAKFKSNYGPDTIFVLRYRVNGRRVWETLDANHQTYTQALAAARMREGSILYNNFAPVAKQVAKPKPDVLMMDAAIDTYLENVKKRQKSKDTLQGYHFG